MLKKFLLLMLGLLCWGNVHALKYTATDNQVFLSETANGFVHFPRDNPFSQNAPFLSGSKTFSFIRDSGPPYPAFIKVRLTGINPNQLQILPNGEVALFSSDNNHAVALVIHFNITAEYTSPTETRLNQATLNDLETSGSDFVLATYPRRDTVNGADFNRYPNRITVIMSYRAYLNAENISPTRPSPEEESFIIPDITFNVSADGIRNDGQLFILGGITTVSLRGNVDTYTVKRLVSYCTVPLALQSSQIKLQTATPNKLPQINSEFEAGSFDLSVEDCYGRKNDTFPSQNINDISDVYVTFSDYLNNGSSNTTILTIEQGPGNAKGVGLRIYPEDSLSPVQFVEAGKRLTGVSEANAFLGDNRAVRMNYSTDSTRIGKAKKNFKVKYVRTGELETGAVKAAATFTFSYQ